MTAVLPNAIRYNSLQNAAEQVDLIALLTMTTGDGLKCFLTVPAAYTVLELELYKVNELQ